MNPSDAMKNVPPHLTLAAVGWVGSEDAMDDSISALENLLRKLAGGVDKRHAFDLAKALEITKSIHVLRHKSIRSTHTLMTALIQELAAKP